MRLYPILALACTALAAISPYRIVDGTTTDGIVSQATTATGKHVGVSGQVGAAAAGDRLDIHTQGVVPVLYGGTVAYGDKLTSDSTGRAIVATTDTARIVGIAQENGVVGDIGSVLLSFSQNEGSFESSLRTVSFDATDVASPDTNGTALAKNVGAALPANAIVDAVVVRLTTPASGGSVATCLLVVGTAGDDDAIIDDFDAMAAANTSDTPRGVKPNGYYGGAQLIAKLTPDAGHKVSDLTALALTVDVYFHVP